MLQRILDTSQKKDPFQDPALMCIFLDLVWDCPNHDGSNAHPFHHSMTKLEMEW
jgi:hypothetical protein